MKDIIIVCEAGITTSLLVTKLKKLSEEENQPMNIKSQNTEEGLDYVKDHSVDMVLLGPQIHHKTELYKAETNAPVMKISVGDYNNMNVYSIFEQINEVL